MSEDEPHDPVGPHRCRAVSAEVLNHLADELANRADGEGRVAVSEVRRLIERLVGGDGQAAALYTQVFASCNALMEERRHAQRRRDTFSRAVIARLDPLLDAAAGDDRLPRHVIPGMISALHHVLGEETMAEYRERCSVVVRELREAQGRNFHWGDLPREPRVRAMVTHAQLALASAFRSFRRRRDWLIGLMDYHGRLRGAGIDAPAFTEWQCLITLEAMVGDIDPDDPAIRAEVGAHGADLLRILHANLAEERTRLEDQRA